MLGSQNIMMGNTGFKRQGRQQGYGYPIEIWARGEPGACVNWKLEQDSVCQLEQDIKVSLIEMLCYQTRCQH